MLIYFALESQTQKPLRSIILHKNFIFVNVLHFDLSCWPMDESNMVFHQYGSPICVLWYYFKKRCSEFEANGGL